LVGPTRLGKTQFSRSLGPHVYWNGLTNLETFNPNANYIIFDDIDFEYMPNRKQWWGAQKEFVATDKYRRKQTIQWGKPLIFLCNEEDDPRHSPKWSLWFDNNTVVVEIKNKLY
jgi:hypothetical protein